MVALNEVVDAVIECACAGLEQALRPACACYPVIGTPMWRPCCECGAEGTSGELTVSLENMYPVDGRDLTPVSRVESCRRGSWAADLAIQLTRCHPTISGNAELPSGEELAKAARELHDDADTLRRALTCCSDVRLLWRTLGVELDPEGGCSYLIARVTVGLD